MPLPWLSSLLFYSTHTVKPEKRKRLNQRLNQKNEKKPGIKIRKNKIVPPPLPLKQHLVVVFWPQNAVPKPRKRIKNPHGKIVLKQRLIVVLASKCGPATSTDCPRTLASACFSLLPIL